MHTLVKPQNISLGKKPPQDDKELMEHQASYGAIPIVLIATTLACCQLY
jgi:hypothetical protein